MTKTKRVSLILLGAVLAVAALLVAAYFFEEKLGREEWERVRAEMEARGETFDFAKLAPPNVPDDENFAMTPLLRPMLDYDFDPETHAQTWRDPAGKERAESIRLGGRDARDMPRVVGWQEGKSIPLEEWAAWFRASDVYEVPAGGTPAEAVLGALRKFDPEIDELTEAASRPFGRFPVHYGEGARATLGHLNVLMGIEKIIALRASARLDAADTDGALEDVLSLFRIQWLMREEITLIDHLVAISLFDVSVQPIWEARLNHRWNDQQWAKVEDALARFDFLSGYQRAMRGEVAFAKVVYQSVHRDPKSLREVLAWGGAEETGWMTPLLFLRGTLYRSQAYHAQMAFDHLIPVLDPASHRVLVENSDAFDEEVASQQSRAPRPHRILALMSLPVFSSVQVRSAQAAALCDLARVAIALERYRLATGAYPARLDALGPRFLDPVPHDVITGEPLKYRPVAESIQLYSVGWNTTDEGGALARKPDGKSLDRKLGDWIWPVSRVEPD